MFNKREKRYPQTKNHHTITNIVPKGTLIHLAVNDVRPNPNNPRRLFDSIPLRELKDSIRQHGVLVPITAYKLPGQEKYGIVDGERRYRCCLELSGEGMNIQIPANIVDSPDKMASLIYMFNIHSFREQWELMPTALSLQEVIDELNVRDSVKLHEITGLSLPQIERCKKILSFPKEFQQLSLDSDPTERVPSNFWVELYPVLEKSSEIIPDLYEDIGRDGITQNLVEKYKAKNIKSVIHFRRVMEAIEVAEDDEGKNAVADQLREYVMNPELETRAAFDDLIRDTRKVQMTVDACEKFINDLRRAKTDYVIEGKEKIIEKLSDVIVFSQNLVDKLQGDDAIVDSEE